MDRKLFSVLVLVLSLLVLTLAAPVASVSAYDYYIAGTAITDESRAFVDILNPSDTKARVEFTAFFAKNKSKSFVDFINPGSARRIDLATHIPGVNAGLRLESDVPVAVEHFTYDPEYSAGFGSVAALEPGFVWYFADGYSSESERTFLFITNPSGRTADVDVTLYYDNGQKKTFNVEVPSEKNRKIDLKEHSLPDKQFGIKVTGTAPVVAETVNLDRTAKAASGGLGSASLSDTWYFAEGYTSVSANEEIHLMNPDKDIAHGTVTFYYSDGTTQSFDITIDAFGKTYIPLNTRARDTEWFSIVVETDVEIVAELKHHDSAYTAGHGGVGATTLSEGLLFADGSVNSMSKGYLALFNQYDGDATVNITFYYDDSTEKSIETTAAGMRRSTVQLNKVALPDRWFGFSVMSDIPIVVQHVQFDTRYSSGASSFGIAFETPDMDDGIIVEREEDAPSGMSQSGTSEDMMFIGEEEIDVSKFGNAMGNLIAVKKSEYSVAGDTVIVWVFGYSSKGEAKEGFEAVLSGRLFELLERTPEDYKNVDMYYIVTEKSEGYAMEWVENTVIVSLASRGQAESAKAILAEMIGSHAPDKCSWCRPVFIVILVILVLLLIRRLIKGREEPDADEFDLVVEHVEEEEKKPKDTVKKKVKKSAKRKKKEHPPKPAPVKSVKEIETDIKKEIKEEKKETKVMKKQAKKAKKDFEKMVKESTAKSKKKKKAKPVKKAEVEKIVKEASKSSGKKTAGKKRSDDDKTRSIKEIAKIVEFDDVVKNIPDYDQVFRMVNRDQDEIKSK